MLRALLPLVGSPSQPRCLHSTIPTVSPSEQKAITVSYSQLTQKYQALVLELALSQQRVHELEAIVSRQTQDLLAADREEREWQSQKQSHAAELAGDL